MQVAGAYNDKLKNHRMMHLASRISTRYQGLPTGRYHSQLAWVTGWRCEQMPQPGPAPGREPARAGGMLPERPASTSTRQTEYSVGNQISLSPQP